MYRTIAVLLCAVGALVALSVTMLASAMMLKAGESLVHAWVVRQAIACFLGFAALTVIGAADYHRWQRFIWWFYGAVVVLLVLVLSPLGHAANGAQRWLWGVQPSDFAKPALIAALAWYGSRYSSRMKSFWFGTLAMLAIALPLIALILIEPDKGTAALLALVALLVMVVAGVRLTHVAVPAIATSVLFVALISTSDYARKRWETFLHPESNRDAYRQVQQGLYAFGAGGTEGAGLGRGLFKFKISEQHTDFIFPVVGEELGLPFTLLVVSGFVVILLCGASIAHQAPDRFGELLAAGATFVICTQSLVNMGVVTDLLPNKGMPLPFVSRGGTEVVVMFALIGILVSIARQAVPSRAATEGSRRTNPFAADTDFPG
jgi:cell division protein FtsW